MRKAEKVLASNGKKRTRRTDDMKVKAERAMWAMNRTGGEWRELVAYYDEERERDMAKAARGSNDSQDAVLIDDDAQEVETQSSEQWIGFLYQQESASSSSSS